jgi:hypothetical protein
LRALAGECAVSPGEDGALLAAADCGSSPAVSSPVVAFFFFRQPHARTQTADKKKAGRKKGLIVRSVLTERSGSIPRS